MTRASRLDMSESEVDVELLEAVVGGGVVILLCMFSVKDEEYLFLKKIFFLKKFCNFFFSDNPSLEVNKNNLKKTKTKYSSRLHVVRLLITRINLSPLLELLVYLKTHHGTSNSSKVRPCRCVWRIVRCHGLLDCQLHTCGDKCQYFFRRRKFVVMLYFLFFSSPFSLSILSFVHFHLSFCCHALLIFHVTRQLLDSFFVFA